MRTAEEIKAWLESREWYGEYKAAVEDDDSNIEAEVTEMYLSGERGDMTIAGAFLWPRTPEGYVVWKERAAEFREWYNN